MIIRQIFKSKDLLDIQEELRRVYGNNFVIIEVNHIKKKPIPFLPFFKKELTEVYIEIPDKDKKSEEDKQNKANFEKSLQEELFLKEIKELKKEILSIKEELERKKEKRNVVKIDTTKQNLSKEDENFLHQLGDEALELFDILIEKGFSENLALNILKNATGYDIENELFDLKDNKLNSLTLAFKKLFEFNGLETQEGKKIVALIGPTGVGKTTTIAKIVSNLVLNNQKSVGVISLDTFRVGGAQRLESFLKVLEIPFRKADTKKAFDTALEDFSDRDFIFVDIAGRSVYEDLSWKEIYNIFKGIPEENFMSLLTLSFNMSEKVALEIYTKLKEFKLHGLVLTKADETQKRGIILNAVSEMELPMYYFTNGQKVPHNLLTATPQNLSKLILE